LGCHGDYQLWAKTARRQNNGLDGGDDDCYTLSKTGGGFEGGILELIKTPILGHITLTSGGGVWSRKKLVDAAVERRDYHVTNDR